MNALPPNRGERFYFFNDLTAPDRSYNEITYWRIYKNRSVRAKVIKIGNSRGIRIPRTLQEQTGLSDEVEMTVDGN